MKKNNLINIVEICGVLDKFVEIRFNSCEMRSKDERWDADIGL